MKLPDREMTVQTPENALWRPERIPATDAAPDLTVWVAGSGSAEKTFVCVHGITAQHRSFTDIATSLTEDPSVRVVGIDLRGRGDSGKPESGYGLTEHGRDVVRVMDHLNLDTAVLVGHSMGAFVVTEAARKNPARVESLVLLDGGWARPEEEPSEEQQEAIRVGLERAFGRLDRTFATSEEYLDFWFPDQGLTYRDLPPSLADYYLYDLGEVEGGYRPKASRKAAEEDSTSMSSESPTAMEMRKITTPVYLVRAEQGFFPGSPPLISDAARDEIVGALDVREELFLDGANHYTMMFEPYAMRTADLLRKFVS